MNQLFYLVLNGAQDGPYTYEQLKIKAIKNETLVWTEGLDNWTRAEHVSILKDLINKLPPPLLNESKKAESMPPPPISATTTSNKYFGYELASVSERFFAVIIEFIITIIPQLFLCALLEIDTISLKSTIAISIISLFYGAICYPIFSGNIGHKLTRLKVISSVDGSEQNNALNGALREGLKSFTSIFILPIIWLLWDADNQNLYDKAVKTYVVRRK